MTAAERDALIAALPEMSAVQIRKLVQEQGLRVTYLAQLKKDVLIKRVTEALAAQPG